MHFNKTKDTIGRWAVIVILLGFCLQQQGWAVAKVFLKNGETREGAVLARDGRITIKAVDRLFQHPESAVHRIDHVSGETMLVNTDGVLLKEKPERLSKNLIAIPKGCEVRVTGKEADWTRVEVYGGKSLAEGYIHNDDLADSVFFYPVNPTIRFEDPPTDLKNRFDAFRKKRGQINRVGDLIGAVADETDFNELLSQRLYGQNLEDVLKDQEESEEGRETESAVDEDMSSLSSEPKNE